MGEGMGGCFTSSVKANHDFFKTDHSYKLSVKQQYKKGQLLKREL